jgi:lipopolysaccharide/colanic/teichoic acid biosynthesis glycosyltransferase
MAHFSSPVGEQFVKQRRSLNSALDGYFAGNSESRMDREILSQEAFHRIIRLERHRTERSLKPFLLMLVDMGEHLPAAAIQKNVSNFLSALAESTRAIDVAGWYENSRVIGVMFTEIGTQNRETIVNTMKARLSDVLRSRLVLEQVRISFHLFPEDWNQDASKRPSNPVLYPDLSTRAERKRGSGVLKRAMDVVGSSLALVIGAPVFLVIAAAIRVTSKGPVFFRQNRIGQHGVQFVFFKFRSMCVDNDPSVHREYVTKLIAGNAEQHPARENVEGEGVFKLTHDPRITRLGAFLRRTSLDELPQFINVLKGEMSLVGPRPALPYEVEAYDLWHRRRVLEAKPGITGLWQVAGRNRVPFDEMVRLDLKYAQSWSPWLDLKILLRTPKAVLEGAH